MQRSIFLIVLAYVSAILLVSCGNTPSQSAQAQPLNLLVSTTGTVQLRRDQWNKYQPAPIGTRLYPTDLLDVQGSAMIVCDIAGVPTVQPAKAIGKPKCPEQGNPLEYGGARFRSGQRSQPKDIPYIRFPRRTLISNANPTLVWHDTKASSYNVSIVDANGKLIWEQKNVTGTSINYPKNAPVLQPGITYQVVVQDDQGKTSDNDPATDLGFRVLSTSTQVEIKQHQQAIQKLTNIDSIAQNLTLAVYYATRPEENERGLFGDALLLFDNIKQTQDTAAIQLWRGDMLSAMRLSDEAVSVYESALQQANSSNDRASQAEAQAGLWRVTGDMSHFDNAIKIYQDVGDEMAIQALRKELTP